MTHFNPFFSLFLSAPPQCISPQAKGRIWASHGLSDRFFGWVRDLFVITVLIGGFISLCLVWFFLLVVML